LKPEGNSLRPSAARDFACPPLVDFNNVFVQLLVFNAVAFVCAMLYRGLKRLAVTLLQDRGVRNRYRWSFALHRGGFTEAGAGLGPADSRTGWNKAGSARPEDEKSSKRETSGALQGCKHLDTNWKKAPSQIPDNDRRTGRLRGRVADSSAQQSPPGTLLAGKRKNKAQRCKNKRTRVLSGPPPWRGRRRQGHVPRSLKTGQF